MFVLPAERSSASFSPRGLAADLALNVNLIATSGAFLPPPRFLRRSRDVFGGVALPCPRLHPLCNCRSNSNICM